MGSKLKNRFREFDYLHHLSVDNFHQALPRSSVAPLPVVPTCPDNITHINPNNHKEINVILNEIEVISERNMRLINAKNMLNIDPTVNFDDQSVVERERSRSSENVLQEKERDHYKTTSSSDHLEEDHKRSPVDIENLSDIKVSKDVDDVMVEKVELSGKHEDGIGEQMGRIQKVENVALTVSKWEKEEGVGSVRSSFRDMYNCSAKQSLKDKPQCRECKSRVDTTFVFESINHPHVEDQDINIDSIGPSWVQRFGCCCKLNTSTPPPAHQHHNEPPSPKYPRPAHNLIKSSCFYCDQFAGINQIPSRPYHEENIILTSTHLFDNEHQPSSILDCCNRDCNENQPVPVHSSSFNRLSLDQPANLGIGLHQNTSTTLPCSFVPIDFPCQIMPTQYYERYLPIMTMGQNVRTENARSTQQVQMSIIRPVSWSFFHARDSTKIEETPMSPDSLQVSTSSDKKDSQSVKVRRSFSTPVSTQSLKDIDPIFDSKLQDCAQTAALSPIIKSESLAWAPVSAVIPPIKPIHGSDGEWRGGGRQGRRGGGLGCGGSRRGGGGGQSDATFGQTLGVGGTMWKSKRRGRPPKYLDYWIARHDAALLAKLELSKTSTAVTPAYQYGNHHQVTSAIVN